MTNDNTGLTQFSIGGNLDASDILTIVTSRAEAKFQTELGHAKGTLKEAEKTLREAKKSLAEAVKAQSTKMVENATADIVDGIKALGGSIQTEHKETLDLKGKVSGSITIKQSNGYGCVVFTMTDDPNRDVVRAQEDVSNCEASVEKAQETAMGWKRKLTNVPMLERRYKARIAEEKLKDSDEGQRLLAVLTGELDNDILALPNH